MIVGEFWPQVVWSGIPRPAPHYDFRMALRPSVTWREQVAEEAAEHAAGRCDHMFIAELFPESLLADTDAALSAFEAELRFLDPTVDQDVFDIVERVVRDLNRINDQHGGSAYETGEREQLCDYIDAALHEVRVDVEALAARHRLGRWEITDEWRRW